MTKPKRDIPPLVRLNQARQREGALCTATNLFEGDRVRLAAKAWSAYRMRKSRTRIGTVVTDTLRRGVSTIGVRWDGNDVVNNSDHYAPDQLELYEEEDIAC